MFLQYLVVFICLNAFVDPVWSNSSKASTVIDVSINVPVDNDTCVQKTVKNNCCKFPFVHNGKTYHSCTKDDSGLLGFFGYYWCYYDDKNTDECKEPLNPTTPVQSTPSTTPTLTPTPTNSTKEQRKSSQTSSWLHATVSSVLVSVIPSHETHPSRLSISSSSPTTVIGQNAETKSSKGDVTKQDMYIILGCGIGGGILLVMILALTVIIYLNRKKTIKVKKDEEEKGDQHEMTSYRLTDATNNPVYESIDKDLDIKSDEERRALQPPHVYEELEDPQNPTSCTHEYSIPYETSVSNSYGPKITPALNEADSFVHFNELYETK